MKEKDLSKLTAVALEYNPDEDAPKVVASGKGALAQKILEKGKESGVPVHKDDKLANTLSKLEKITFFSLSLTNLEPTSKL